MTDSRATRYVCVHGHAYQPPREDPETGDVELQPSAAPYHDWNQRIAAECYGPLGRAQILRDDGTPRRRINLWGEMSFDLGPTLGTWMDHHAPDVAELVASGDRSGGSHSAMAHPWVHAILPLTPARDRSTIVRWGLDDFRRRFGREATGMWLPETAVDTASLETLADHGLTWTLVAPHQVTALDGAPSDHHPLLIPLPSGRTITAVPYHGALSHGVAFGGMLDDGVAFARTVVSGSEHVTERNGAPGLTIVSTDIESFGHHHRFGEMALARAVEEWEHSTEVVLTTPAAYLARYPATDRGRLVERTSWSCAHGVERWRSNCGCRFSEVPGEDQRWRRPLRDLLDSLADVAERLVERHAGLLLADPWQARDDYGAVLSSSPADRRDSTERFIDAHVIDRSGADRAIAWMEAERLRLEAWSSCAWFFDSPDRIETMQSIAQAMSAVHRMDALSGAGVSGWFREQVMQTGVGVGLDEDVSALA